jgi:peptide/nickel transport system substrate-binding protein
MLSKAGSRKGIAHTGLSRRRLIAVTAIGATGIGDLLLASCSTGKKANGKAGTSSGTAVAGKPQQGGVFRFSNDFSRGFDPHVLQATTTGGFGVFYSTLVRSNPKTYELEPDLAVKWEVPSPTEIVFTLAPNVRWHDKPPVNGRALKVDDIIYSYNRLGSSDPKFVNKSYVDNIDKMEAVSATSLKLTLKTPSVVQLSNLALPSLQVLAPEVVEKSGGKMATAETVVGTGAFILQQSEVGVGSSLVRNPNYFKPGLPYLDRLEIRGFKDAESEWAALLAGQLDERWVPGQETKSFAAAQQNRYNLAWGSDVGYFITQAAVQKKPFNDARVTRALRLLIDHDEFRTGWTEVWFGRGRFSTCFNAGTADNWDLTEDEYRQHLEWKQSKDDAIKEAVALLGAAGFTKASPLRFTLSGSGGTTTPFEGASVQLLQAQFKRNSQGAVDPAIRLVDTAAWASVRANSDFEYYVSGHSAGSTDPDAYLSGTYQTGGGRNYGKASDPQLDQMIAKQRTLFDEQERKKAVREIVLYMIDHMPYSAIDGRYVLTASPLAVQGAPAESAGSLSWCNHYENIWVKR